MKRHELFDRGFYMASDVDAYMEKVDGLKRAASFVAEMLGKGNGFEQGLAFPLARALAALEEENERTN